MNQLIACGGEATRRSKDECTRETLVHEPTVISDIGNGIRNGSDADGESCVGNLNDAERAELIFVRRELIGDYGKSTHHAEHGLVDRRIAQNDSGMQHLRRCRQRGVRRCNGSGPRPIRAATSERS